MSSFIDDLTDLFDSYVDAQPGATDEYGTFVPSGAALNLLCRIEGDQRLVRDSGGQEVTSSVQVIVAGYNDLTVEGFRYTLPVRYNPRLDLRAIAIDKESDEGGDLFEVVLLP